MVAESLEPATHDLLAERLERARSDAAPIAPLAEVLAVPTVADAYAIQRAGIAARTLRGARLVGHKIGLTSAAVQAQLGVGEPDYGALLDDMHKPDGHELSRSALIAPRVEVEVAFVLSAPLAGPDVDVGDVTAATAHVRAAIEIVDSRIADWRVALFDTIADNASSAAFVLGDRITHLDEVDVADIAVDLVRGRSRVADGHSSAVLGDPRRAVAWLANALHRHGVSLQAGDVVLSGACTRMVDAYAGDRFRAKLGPLGEVAVRFGR
ncbi:2-keto-4-pentenoate hydratase [Baekduia alba]|uniref:2-keto-4-pentenoate hydratase n=1 Tax=Baekduia alba TaxID=2997333 RepID=UPI002341CBEF|nr:fumarylacetoacetate hydrolase family protein [Baekduia alba]WCB95257.1 2-keto-4-pentenoate hydratase [Baekduia alba]